MVVIYINNRINKPKKSATDLISKLGDEKGVAFSMMDEATAIAYISERNNYLRTASYRKNYSKHQFGDEEGKYINLEFSYLAELSTLDMYLRSYILKMCIDVEHALKVDLLHQIEENPNEDGYTIVDKFLQEYPTIFSDIERKSDAIFTGDLIEKYFDLCLVFDGKTAYTKILHVDCPIWVLVEIIGFGDLVRLYDFYYSQYPERTAYRTAYTNKKVLNPIRSLRNACAHNNCLLNSLAPCKKTQPPALISKFIAGMPNVQKEERQKKLSCRPLFEIVCLLYCYDGVVSSNVKKNRMDELKTFADDRLVRNIRFFQTNTQVSTSIEFLQKIIDNLA